MNERCPTSNTADRHEGLCNAHEGTVPGEEVRYEDGVGVSGRHRLKVPPESGYRREPVPCQAMFVALTLRVGNGPDDSFERVHDLFDRRVAPEFLLGENQIVTRDDLEDATARWNQGDIAYVMLVSAEDRLNHAHGTVGIASGSAVFDG